MLYLHPAFRLHDCKQQPLREKRLRVAVDEELSTVPELRLLGAERGLVTASYVSRR
jgi:hypothetical protein